MAADDAMPHQVKRKYMSYFKMGDGPLYIFYALYHLPHIQLPHSVARAVLFKDATLASAGRPVCDTLAVAKRDLKGAGLNGGIYLLRARRQLRTCRRDDLLPMALSVGCRLKRDVPNQPIGYRDVELPRDRLCDKLRPEQTAYFEERRPAEAPIRASGAVALEGLAQSVCPPVDPS